MKNHFYISYFGNKRDEVEEIFDNLDFKNIKFIVEPFCGSCAISYYISTKKDGMKYILNDNNIFLLEMYKIIKNNKSLEFENTINEIIKTIQTKETYNKYINENKNNIYGWFIGHKYYNIRPFLFPQENKFNPIKLSNHPIYDFFINNDIEFYNLEAIEIYEKYKTRNDCLIILDPPYMSVTNSFYVNPNFNIYEYLYKNNMKKEKAKIYLILEDIWIIKILFDKFKLSSYDKMYLHNNSKKTKHSIYYNKINNNKIKNKKYIE
jgi:hypothetical protein